MEWSKTDILALIEAYRARPALWDPNHPDVRVKTKRTRAMAELATLFDCDSGEIYRKLHSLRSQFNREHRLVARSGVGGPPYRPKWFAYDKLWFMTHAHNKGSAEDVCVILNEGTSSSRTEEAMYFKEEPSIDDEETPTHKIVPVIDELLRPPAEPSTRYGAPSQSSTNSDARNEAGGTPPWPLDETNLSTSGHVTTMQSKQDAYDVFGAHVGNELRRLQDERSIAVAKFKINTVLFEAAMGTYKSTNSS